MFRQISPTSSAGLKKRREEHDYKFPLAIDDEVPRTGALWRPRLLATSLLHGGSPAAPDFALLARVRAFA